MTAIAESAAREVLPGARVVWGDPADAQTGEVVSTDDVGLNVRTDLGGSARLRWDTAGLAPLAEGALSGPEAEALARHEETIQAGLRSFMAVGTALGDILERRLYRGSHTTFEEYCRERWNLSRSYAYRQIAAAEVVSNLSPIGDTESGADGGGEEPAAPALLPTNEAQTRPLQALSPEQQREAWQHATTKAAETGAAVSAAIVEQAAQAVAPPVQPTPDPVQSVPASVQPEPPEAPPAAEWTQLAIPETEAVPVVQPAIQPAIQPETGPGLETGPDAAPAAVIDAPAAAAVTTEPAPAPRPGALKTAEEIVAEKAGQTVPTTVGATEPEAPMVLCPVAADVRDWLRGDGLAVSPFLVRLKAAAYGKGLSAAEVLSTLEGA